MRRFAGYLLIGVFSAVLVVAGYQLYEIWDTYHEADEEYREIKQVAEGPEKDPEGEDPGEQGKQGEEKQEDAIHFERLKQINPDIVAWLRIEAAGINYPVVQGTDNEHYLHYTFRGEENIAGSIFMDYRNAKDFSDAKVILYGHNMRDGSMFAKLKKLDMKEEHKAVIYTPEKTYNYRLIGKDYVDKNDVIYQLSEEKNGEDKAQALILSTCSSDASTRYIIVGKIGD